MAGVTNTELGEHRVEAQRDDRVSIDAVVDKGDRAAHQARRVRRGGDGERRERGERPWGR